MNLVILFTVVIFATPHANSWRVVRIARVGDRSTGMAIDLRRKAFEFEKTAPLV